MPEVKKSLLPQAVRIAIWLDETPSLEQLEEQAKETLIGLISKRRRQVQERFPDLDRVDQELLVLGIRPDVVSRRSLAVISVAWAEWQRFLRENPALPYSLELGDLRYPGNQREVQTADQYLREAMKESPLGQKMSEIIERVGLSFITYDPHNLSVFEEMRSLIPPDYPQAQILETIITGLGELVEREELPDYNPA